MRLPDGFDAAALVALSAAADSPATEELFARAPAVRGRGYLTKDDLEAVRQWKWPPSRGRPSTSTPEMVEAATRVALSTPCEQLRVEVLTLLDGVAWPVASVVLHFFHPEPYPVLDRLALRALGHTAPPPYDFGVWWSYTTACRRLAAETGLSMRALDRALWSLGDRSMRV